MSLGGTIIGYLTGVELSADRSQTPFRGLGSYDPQQILKGRRNYQGTARKAYLCGDWLDTFMVNATDYGATFYPRGTAACGTIAGSIALKSWRMTGIETESEAAIIEEIAFDMFAVSTP